MTTTYTELLDKLKQLDEVLILELLDISSEDLIDRFGDLIEARYDQLLEQVQD